MGKQGRGKGKGKEVRVGMVRGVRGKGGEGKGRETSNLNYSTGIGRKGGE